MVAYNEEANLGPCIDEALGFLRANCRDFELIVVDDGSSDGTAAVARAAKAQAPDEIRVVSYRPNRGIGGALTAGWSEATRDWVTWLPADGQVPPIGLKALFAMIEADPQLGIITTQFPTRFSEADSVLRKVLSRGLRGVLWASTGVSREMDGIWLIQRSTLLGLPLKSQTFFLNLEIPIRAIRAGHKAGHVTMPIRPRMSGVSKVVNPAKIKLVLRETLKLGAELRLGVY